MATDDQPVDAGSTGTTDDDSRPGGLRERRDGKGGDGPRYFREGRDGNLEEITPTQIAAKRIGQLTARDKEKDLVISALQQSNDRLERLLRASNDNAASAYEASLKNDLEAGKAEVERVRGELRAAINDGDVDKQTDLQVKLTEATTRVARAQVESETFAKEKEKRKTADPGTGTDGDGRDPAVEDRPQGPSQRVKDWITDNPWFDHQSDEFDQAKYDAAVAIDLDLKRRGVVPESEEYFAQLDRRLKPALAALDASNDDSHDGDRRADDRPNGADKDADRGNDRALAAPARRGDGNHPPPGSKSLRRLTADERAHARSLEQSESIYALGLMRDEGRISEEDYLERYQQYKKAEARR